MQQRLIYLDYIRVLACILVVLTHSPMTTNGVSNIWISMYNYISAPSIGMFFMVSGVLVFPVKKELNIFLRSKLTKLVFPLLFWSVFYIIINILYGESQISKLPEMLLCVLYNSSNQGVLWFLYSLIGLYLFAPIISKWIEKATKRELQYYLALWAITLILPYLNISTSLVGSFNGYMGYMILGYYLSKYSLNINIFTTILITLALSIIFPLLYYYGILSGISNSELYGFLTINIAWLCVVYFTIIHKIKPKANSIITDISLMSFGIYLLHIFIMRRFVWLWIENIFGSLPQIIQIPLIALLTLIISYIIVKLISLLKFSKYIIGV